MIRVNLLRNRKEGLRGLVAEPGASSSFVSGREALLAGLFLVLGGAILWLVLGDNAEPEPAVGSGGSEAASNLPGAEASVTPTRGEAGGASPATLAAPPPASQAASSPLPGTVAASSSGAASSAAAPAGPLGSTLLSGRSSAAAHAAVRPDATAAEPSGSGGVITMTGLSILGEGNSLQILAATDGLPEYKMFRVDKPDRVVIDLAGVRHEIPREYRERRLTNSIVREVRVAQNQIDPPMVRLVLEVESFPALQVLPRPDGLLINITGK